jgi:nitroreductase
MKVVEFAVESVLGNRKSTRNYIIPVPEGKIEEAQKLSSYYNGIA